jgi:hypothetical protein
MSRSTFTEDPLAFFPCLTRSNLLAKNEESRRTDIEEMVAADIEEMVAPR